MNDAAFRLVGLAKTYPNGVPALAPATFDIPAGSFVSVVGPSGCGKSTLLRLLAGLMPPTAGQLYRSAGPAETSFVFQDPTLLPWATAAANVALPLSLWGVSEAGVNEALARVGLGGFESAYPRELSGGMRMRVSLARAIVTDPKILLLDEPFAALDEFTRFQLNDDLLHLWEKNKWTVVFVTHSIREAVFLGRRVLVMSPRPGRVLADLEVNLPERRDSALRASHRFADQCAAVSSVLEEAMMAARAA